VTAHEIHWKYYRNISKENFTKIVSADTISSNLQKNKLGKYGKWLLKLYKRKCLKLEDLYKAADYIAIFDKIAKMNKLLYIDLNHYKSLPEMYRVIKPFIKIKSENEEIRRIKEYEAEKVYEDEAFVVISPKTNAASCLYGKGTQWCTASKYCNRFWDYYSQGNLYIIINKRNGKKYQFHAETKSFMNENDEPINWETCTLKKINATQGLFNYFISKIPYLYHEFLYEKKYNINDQTEFIEDIDDYKCRWKIYHEFGYKQYVYYIGLEDNSSTLYCVKWVGQIIGITQVIDKKFGVEKIIPFKNIARQNEVIIIKGNHTGIYNIDTDTIRWGYKGFVDDRIDWVNNKKVFL